MKTQPTDMIELTRNEGEALWWACDAFFDCCVQKMMATQYTPDRDLLSALIWAGNALRASLKTAGVDRTIERFLITDTSIIRTISTTVVSRDDAFLAMPYRSSDWDSREHWQQASEHTKKTAEALHGLLEQLDSFTSID